MDPRFADEMELVAGPGVTRRSTPLQADARAEGGTTRAADLVGHMVN